MQFRFIKKKMSLFDFCRLLFFFSSITRPWNGSDGWCPWNGDEYANGCNECWHADGITNGRTGRQCCTSGIQPWWTGLCLIFNRGLLDYNQLYRCYFYFLLFAVIIVNCWLWVQCQTDLFLSRYQKYTDLNRKFMSFKSWMGRGGGVKIIRRKYYQVTPKKHQRTNFIIISWAIYK